MEHELVLSNKHTVRYWTHHNPTSPTLVLIHGFTGSHEGFQYLVPILKDFRLIIPDLPGFGTSDLPGMEDWSVDGIARLANEFVAQLNLVDTPYIIGHSMGGLVVSAMVAQAPNLYNREVTLVSPVPTAIRRNDKRRPGAILGALQYRLGHLTGRVGDKLVKSHTITKVLTQTIMTTTDKELQRAIHSHHFKNLDYISSVKFYSHLYIDINRRGSIDYHDALRHKDVYLIAGDADIVTPLKEMKRFAESVNPRIFHIVPGAGHLLHYEHPEKVAALIYQAVSGERA